MICYLLFWLIGALVASGIVSWVAYSTGRRIGDRDASWREQKARFVILDEKEEAKISADNLTRKLDKIREVMDGE